MNTRIQNILFFCCFLVDGFVYAADSDSKIIVVQEGTGKLLKSSPEVFVESGLANLSGSPEQGMKPAYRTWERACSEWEKKLQVRNGKNLMVSDCGTPTRTQETIQSEKWYKYESKATYKIRVSGK